MRHFVSRTLGFLCIGLLAFNAFAESPAPAGTLILHQQMIADPLLQTDAYSILVPDGWKLESNIAWDQIKPVPCVTITVSNPSLHATWKHFPRGFYVDGVRENLIRLYPGRKAQIEEPLCRRKTNSAWRDDSQDARNAARVS